MTLEDHFRRIRQAGNPGVLGVGEEDLNFDLMEELATNFIMDRGLDSIECDA